MAAGLAQVEFNALSPEFLEKTAIIVRRDDDAHERKPEIARAATRTLRHFCGHIVFSPTHPPRRTARIYRKARPVASAGRGFRRGIASD